MKRIFIVHGWGGNPEELLHKLLKGKFSKIGFEVVAPKMPDTNKPKIVDWVSHLNKVVINPDVKTYFIGHSIGCQAIMRYIETLPEKQKIGGCIFIAGWFDLENLEDEEEERIAKPWIEKPINFNKIKKIARKISVYISSNEYYGCIEQNSKIFKEKLGAKVIIEENMGHFTNEEEINKLSRFIKKLAFL